MIASCGVFLVDLGLPVLGSRTAIIESYGADFLGVSEAQFVKTEKAIHSFSNQNQIIVYSYTLNTRPAAVNYVSVNPQLQLNCRRPVYLAIAALNTPNSSLPIYLIQDTIGGCLFSISHSYHSSYYSDYTISISENLPFRN